MGASKVSVLYIYIYIDNIVATVGDIFISIAVDKVPVDS